MDLELLNLTPEKLLVALRRATRARYRYVHGSNARGVRMDPAVDHQLLNHVNLLTSLAVAVNLDAEQIQEAVNRGAAQARDDF